MGRVPMGHTMHVKHLPPHDRPYDSIKVMCTRYNPEYSRQWAQRVPSDESVTNAYPSHFNEYFLPSRGDPGGPHALVQYIGAYERLRRQDGIESVVYVGA